MPKLGKEMPANLRPFVFHGVDFTRWENVEQAEATCPFCDREGKFRVNQETGQWDCKSCQIGTAKGGGNVYTFLRKLWENSSQEGLDELAADRGLIGVEGLAKWGVRRSMTTGEWLVPGYNVEGNLSQLYRYVTASNGKRLLLTTPTLYQQLFGGGLHDKNAQTIYLCEGPWDGIALWEVVQLAKAELTSVLAVPGCGNFAEAWVELCRHKRVFILFDNDHPREVKNQVVQPGLAGMRRTARMLQGVAKEIRYLCWGPDGYDADLPSGHDVRDWLKEGMTPKARVNLYQSLLAKCHPVPQEWFEAKVADDDVKGEVECLDCDSWSVLVNAWRKALRWTEGLDRALSVMLASIASTRSVGDQLWCKIIGPASCGKSTLCEAVSINKRYVVAKSTIRGFHSGFKTGNDEKEDNSLISQLYGKTLVTKDGDTLLQAPNLGQILSEARDLYDSTSRTHYRNKMSKSYEGVRMTWLLCGTSSLRTIDSSELGERFLDCVIMDGIDDELEDEILWRVVHRAHRNLGVESDGQLETQHDAELLLAMRLTGGYVGHLRANAQRLLKEISFPEEAARKCISYGKFVAYMRARPSDRQEEEAEREFAARLVSQMTRLANCLALVLNRAEVDAEVLRRVRRVALDTARGRTLEICRQLYTAGAEGMDAKTLIAYTGQTPEKEKALLRFLRKIGAADHFQVKKAGVTMLPRWKLTERMAGLYGEVMADA